MRQGVIREDLERTFEVVAGLLQRLPLGPDEALAAAFVIVQGFDLLRGAGYGSRRLLPGFGCECLGFGDEAVSAAG